MLSRVPKLHCELCQKGLSLNFYFSSLNYYKLKEMGWCAVYGCNNSKNLHRFPHKNTELCRIWIHRCYRNDTFNATTARICSKHFDESSYKRDLRNELLQLPLRRILKADALPTLHLPTCSSTIVSSNKNTPRAVRLSRRDQHQLAARPTAAESVSVRDPSPNTLISKLKHRVKLQTRKILFLQRRVKTFRDKYNKLLKKRNDYLSAKLSGVFTPGQIKCLLNNTKSTRWTTTDLQTAVRLRTISKKAYMFLRDVRSFPLPGLSTLSEWIKKLFLNQDFKTTSLRFCNRNLIQ